MNTQAYKLIKQYYGNRTAKRSGVPLMNHIDEGLAILDKLNASINAKDAYCLHPIFQSNDDFNNNINMDLTGINPNAIALTIEYRHVANSYLSTGKLKDFIGFTNTDIYHMLYADKYQNYKDFKKYHQGIHPRSKQLTMYFDNWIKMLSDYNYKP